MAPFSTKVLQRPKQNGPRRLFSCSTLEHGSTGGLSIGPDLIGLQEGLSGSADWLLPNNYPREQRMTNVSSGLLSGHSVFVRSPVVTVLQMTGTFSWKVYLIFVYVCVCVCVCLCVLQSPTARRCGWWCSLCACRWWLSPSSSSSSSAPWDTTAACRAPRVRDGVTPAPARQSTRCSFHDIITNLSVRQLCKRGGADLRRVFAQIMQSAPVFFLSAHESKQSLHTHHPAYLFLMKLTLTARWCWVILTFLQYLSVHHLFRLFPRCLSLLPHSFQIITGKCYSLLFNKLTQVESNWTGVTGRCLFITWCQ